MERVAIGMTGLGRELAGRHFQIAAHDGVQTIGVILCLSGKSRKIGEMVQLQGHWFLFRVGKFASCHEKLVRFCLRVKR